MNIDPNELQAKIRVNNAAAQAKKAGAQVSPEVAAIIREAWKAKVSISVIRESLRQMGIAMSPTMVSKTAKSPNPRKKRVPSVRATSVSPAPALPARSGPIDLPPFQSGPATVPAVPDARETVSAAMEAMAGRSPTNAATRSGARG